MTQSLGAAVLPDSAAPDPSMEDILASIRRILDDGSTPAPADGTISAASGDDVFELDRSMMIEESAAEIEPAVAEPVAESPLLAPQAAAAAGAAMGSLARTMGRQTRVFPSGPTLEDMVRAELRPLVKTWLDQNLPPMVERLVRAEIERVARDLS